MGRSPGIVWLVLIGKLSMGNKDETGTISYCSSNGLGGAGQPRDVAVREDDEGCLVCWHRLPGLAQREISRTGGRLFPLREIPAHIGHHSWPRFAPALAQFVFKRETSNPAKEWRQGLAPSQALAPFCVKRRRPRSQDVEISESCLLLGGSEVCFLEKGPRSKETGR
ncbi:hypothetical protein B0T22DRAFT_297316 [Podospora appendiculata]|uniref:Uncharacterized protein n=1 Tax=Podospora appendiculata TaxID=314037 RepID=A0AAE0X1R2_9PEZI|nr:hypothetical protein B0T22DRAFT_297316 [Podospora appendiculata]